MSRKFIAPVLTDDQVESLRRRFNAKTIHNPVTGCTYWAGAKTGRTKDNRGGYPEIGVARRTAYAHRAAFRLTYGRWPKTELHHTCTTRHCVAGAHLEESINHAEHMKEHARIRSTRGKCQLQSKMPPTSVPMPTAEQAVA